MTPRRRPVRVVHIVPSSFGRHFGGQTHYLYSLLSGWRDREVTLDLWGASVKPLNIGSGTLDYALSDGGALWSSPVIPGRVGRLREAASLAKMLILRARDYDIVHFHYLWWGEIFSPVILHRMGKKVVYTMSLLGSDNPAAFAEAGVPVVLDLLRLFDGFVALSPALAQDCTKHGLANVVVLPNFLAIPELEGGRDSTLRADVRARLGISSGAHVLLFVGGAIHRKGLDVLAEAYPRVASNCPDTRLILVGPSRRCDVARLDFSYIDEQRKRLRAAGNSQSVVWTGMVANKRELVGYYSAADVFVFPTRREGLGNVLVEAMAAGLPTVATNLPGITDSVVVDGETGFLVPPDDPDALARAIQRLLTEPLLHARMSRAARARSCLFSFENYSKRLREFYLTVLGSRNRED